MNRCSVWVLALGVAALAGCGGGSKDCGSVCTGQCGEVSGCNCGSCDVCQGDECGSDGACVAACGSRECGDDGCGGTCGVCTGGLTCNDQGMCIEPCVPDCDGKECGDDGCGELCSECSGGLECDKSFKCVLPCESQCLDRECGEDGCGSTCGECPLEKPYCQDGICKIECEPVCDGVECGDNGCGGDCGDCGEGYSCSEAGTCECVPDCSGYECGDDGCGDLCGECSNPNDVCVAGLCECSPDCVEKECGEDGCGGSCGSCPYNHVCTDDGTCVCLPTCEDKQCGPDGCGSICGLCGCGEDCLMYQCEFTACEGKDCGWDGCGGSCGECGAGKACVAGKCPPEGKECEDSNSVDWDGCNEGELVEFLVNQSVNGVQDYPSIASLESGNYVIVWQDSMGDSESIGIKGRVFPIDGSEADDEFLVNTYQFSTQNNPAVAALVGGGFVVVWQSMGQDGYLEGIFGQVFKASGAKLGPEFQVNTFVQYAQKNPSVTTLADGTFAVVWEGAGQDGMGFGVFGQRFTATGEKSGPEFQLNTTAVADQQWASVAGLSGGGMITVWGSYVSGPVSWDVYAQKWDQSGDAAGGEFMVNSPWGPSLTTINSQAFPKVASTGENRFVVVWQSQQQDGSDEGVFGQMFGAQGKSGSELQINSTTLGAQQSASVAGFGDGQFVVVWQAPNQDGSGTGIIGRRFKSDGSPVAAEFAVNQLSDGEQTRPKVSTFSDGSFAVAWQSDPGDGFSTGVFARRYGPDGLPTYR